MFLSEDQLEQLDKTLSEEGVRLRRRQANKNPASLWKFPVPYYFDASISNVENFLRHHLAPTVQQQIRDVIAYYEQYTCARFTESNSASPRLRYFKGPGCYSLVGVQNQTEQDVSIGSGCEYVIFYSETFTSIIVLDNRS